MGSASENSVYDAVIVGAGFSGLFMLNSLRSEGLKVILFETGAGIGGTWYWNQYPGARVDSQFEIYQFSTPKLYQDFDFNERFASRDEIIRYFAHVDKTLDLSKDIKFNSTVNSARFHSNRNKWLVKTKSTQDSNSEKNVQVWSKHLILCTGFASKIYIPPFPGLDKFQGKAVHTSRWHLLQEDNDALKSKKIAVIGTGASGVQIIQELGLQLSPGGQLTVYQRTPNIALPMQQCPLHNNNELPENIPKKETFPRIFQKARTTFGGTEFDATLKNAMDVSAEERREFYKSLLSEGGLIPWVGNYQDVLLNKEANDSFYDFWAERTRARILDERKRDILAPLIPAHAFGTKRPSLEQAYYEVFNKENVDIIDINTSPILEITEKGIKTEVEGILEFDIIVLATGFDAVTGGILDIKIENGVGQSIQDKWKGGVNTNLGISVAGFPNLFFLYGPQAPTAFSNGPTSIEIQGEWLTRLIVNMQTKNYNTIVSTENAEFEWVNVVKGIWNATLFAGTKSPYDGSNIPGKIREPLNFTGGIPYYINALNQCEMDNYRGFILE